ncbi:CRP/FNR family transcriptional regulator [Stanieria sp. NIES-3757]|nr:CRP/FNR family transcriptional regulator [Stanieria sp. NIES-3757]
MNLLILPTNSKLSTFKAHETIPLKSESLLLIRKGIVKTTAWNPEGKIITLGYWGTGDVIGQTLSQASSDQMKCLTFVEAIYTPLKNWNVLLQPICNYIQQTEELLCILRIEKMSDRLYYALCWLANKFGCQIEEETLIELPLTHQELADLIGSSRVTVTRLINQLEQEKMIARPRYCRFSIISQAN